MKQSAGSNQYLSTRQTAGRNCLVNWLTEPEQHPDVIAARQKAVMDIAKSDWQRR